ncbi:hypothetical protein SAMN05216389_12126 [Oceanobacillus limi]|uniref:Uncharacterized protein n=1 Tax=Oceanobacillus limi TaxID=930131 RepID=A0A1I0GHE2_9BACI|nr:hypothetical protein [Oceanobacillus limi]SET69523.1 hypothetical protein SAMN05216389_12126 [Oceanobacillus limi]
MGVKISVNGEKIGDVVNGEFEPVKSFFDFLDYTTPTERVYNVCYTNELICEADYAVSSIADTLKLDWAYKWINHSIDVVNESVAQEWDHVLSLLF